MEFVVEPYADDVIANVARHREIKPAERIKSAVGEAAKVQIQIFELRRPSAAQLFLNPAAGCPSVQVEICVKPCVEGCEDAKIVVNFSTRGGRGIPSCRRCGTKSRRSKPREARPPGRWSLGLCGVRMGRTPPKRGVQALRRRGSPAAVGNNVCPPGIARSKH